MRVACPHRWKFRRRRSSPDRQTPQRWWSSCGVLSDVRISLTGNFSSSHENTTAIFFVPLVHSRWANKSAWTRSDCEGPVISAIFYCRIHLHWNTCVSPSFLRRLNRLYYPSCSILRCPSNSARPNSREDHSRDDARDFPRFHFFQRIRPRRQVQEESQEFSSFPAADYINNTLERGARRARVGLFGE